MAPQKFSHGPRHTRLSQVVREASWFPASDFLKPEEEAGIISIAISKYLLEKKKVSKQVLNRGLQGMGHSWMLDVAQEETSQEKPVPARIARRILETALNEWPLFKKKGGMELMNPRAKKGFYALQLGMIRELGRVKAEPTEKPFFITPDHLRAAKAFHDLYIVSILGKNYMWFTGNYLRAFSTVVKNRLRER